MIFFNINGLRKILCNINSTQIFILSLFICVLFYAFEGLIGIDRFYHPDSSYYLKPTRIISFDQFIDNPKILIHRGYFILTHLLYDNYYFIILFNFILYSLTNVLIYQRIYKKYFIVLDNFRLFLLFYLFFLDPYRLHLSSHILKETCIIFIIIMLITSNSRIIKILSILLLEIFRKNSWVYLILFLTYSNLKKIVLFLNIKKIFKTKAMYYTSTIILIFIISFVLLSQIDQNTFNYTYNFMEAQYNKVFPMRPYDEVNQFKDFGFPLGFILKSITWPILLISGLFFLFVSSALFKILGFIMIINHLFVYLVTKKTYISFGLLIILLMLCIYTSSFTSFYRYSYIAIYSSLIYFFLNFEIDKIKKNL